jgi:hypothetical protein
MARGMKNAIPVISGNPAFKKGRICSLRFLVPWVAKLPSLQTLWILLKTKSTNRKTQLISKKCTFNNLLDSVKTLLARRAPQKLAVIIVNAR